MIDIRQTAEYARYLQKQGWLVERINNTNYFLKKLPLVGFVLKIQRPEEINFKRIDRDLLGEVYQKHLTSETRRSLGQFYTPIGLINHILDQVDPSRLTK